MFCLSTFCFMCLMLPVFLYCIFLIVSSVSSNVYYRWSSMYCQICNQIKKTNKEYHTFATILNSNIKIEERGKIEKFVIKDKTYGCSSRYNYFSTSLLCVTILDGTLTYSCCGCMEAEQGIYIYRMP